MSAPNVITIRPRSLANVLADLKEARRDYDDALGELAGCPVVPVDLDDRAKEAETRLEDLRAEFDARLIDVAGLTIGQIMKAREEALI